MRTIKFRGKRLDNGEWVVGWSLGPNVIIPLDAKYTNTSMGLILHDYYEVLPESVGQWTGLVDGHGTEIYEGDIISVDCYGYEEPEVTVTGQVIMGGLVGVGIVKGSNCEPLIDIQGSYLTEYILCGNCIDNPELMEV